MRSALLPCLLSAFTVTTVLAAPPQYTARKDIATGFQHLQGLAVVDFNGDGIADIAVTELYDKRVVVYLGRKDNTFSAPVSTLVQTSLSTTTGLICVVAGDFNEDGKQDLVVGTNGSEPFIYLSGNGDGTFTQQSAIANSSLWFYNARVVDLDHDSHLDLVVTANPGFIAYLGDGRGNFRRPNPFNSGTILSSDLVAADFNGDTTIDVIDSIPFQNVTPSGILFNSGNGDGTFKPAIVVGDASNSVLSPQYLAIADFNGDGKQDILIAVNYADILFYGKGDGTFDLTNLDSPPTLPPVGPNSGILPLVAAADMNGDGKPDAVIADDASKTIDVDINNGSGNFEKFMGQFTVPDVTLSIDPGTLHLALADLNGDGLPDIVVANSKTQNVSVFFSIPPKTTPAITLTSGASSVLVGTSVSFTAKVTGSTSFTPIGAVTLLEGTTSLDQQTLDANGQATFTLSSLAAGQHSLTASYSGDSNFNPVTSSALAQSIRPKTAPAVSVTSNTSSVLVGTSVSFTAKAISSSGVTPTGTFSLLDGTTSLGQQPLDASGQTTFSLSNLTAGQHSLTATYSGDSNFTTATSVALTQSITDFQIALPTASQTVTAGGAATYTLNVTPAGGLTGSITVTCSQLPTLTTCDPVTVPITGQPATAALTVHTTAPVTRSNSTVHVAAFGLLSIALTALLPLSRRRHLRLLAVITAFTVIGLTAGCSSGTSATKTPVVVTPGTPQGTVPFTVTSTITLGGQTLTRTTTATLVVQ